MVSSEQKALLTILSDYLNNRKTTADFDNFVLIYNLAKYHQLEMIVAYQCMKHIDDENLKESVVNRLHIKVNRNYTVNALLDMFSRNNLQVAMVKGYEIEKLYNPNYLRLMGDTDIIIHPEDRNKAHKLMLEAGFDCMKSYGDEWTYKKNNVFIEIHDSMLHKHEGNEYLVEYFDNLWYNGSMTKNYFMLDWNFHFCYLIQHISGHMIITGVGLRQFVDLIVVINNVSLDWNRIQCELEKLHLWQFARTCLALCKAWFNVNIPIDTEALSTDFILEATARVLNDGTFGLCEKSNKDIHKLVDKSIYGGYKSVISCKIKIIIEALFPSYDAMCKLSYCGKLKNRKLLLPFFWIWRIIYRTVIDRSDASVVVKKKNTDLAEDKIRYLKKWGL